MIWILRFAAGSTLEAMAKAVEKSSLVIICMTQKYKESPSCRTGEDKYVTSVLYSSTK